MTSQGGPLPEVTPMNEHYWAGTKAGELRLRHCNSCGALFRFVRQLCPECWSEDLHWTVASGEGVVLARAIVEVAPYPSMDGKVPYVLALIELAEGVTMMANVLDCHPRAVGIGMPVSVFFEPRGEIALPQFRPAETAARRTPSDSV